LKNAVKRSKLVEITLLCWFLIANGEKIIKHDMADEILLVQNVWVYWLLLTLLVKIFPSFEFAHDYHYHLTL